MTTAYIIRAMGFANGTPCPHEGQYLESFDHDAGFGRGYATFTPKEIDAMRFRSKLEAWEFWRKPSRVKPLREDGQFNRPLTALSVTIVPLP